MSPKLRLFLLSFLMLFVELALIRWAGSNVIYLSYFSNFVLLGSFLGIGVGFLRARAQRDLFPWAAVALLGLMLFVRLAHVQVDRSGGSLIYFGSFRKTGLPTWLVLPIIFVAVAFTMEMIAEGVARTFIRFEPLEAYRLDIVGSIAGIAAFSLVSFLGAPPVVWGIIVAIVFIALGSKKLIHGLVLAGIIGLLLQETLTPGLSWSPYYKIALERNPNKSFGIKVNGIPHQSGQSVEQRRSTHDGMIYFFPYQNDVSPPGDVLIVGAGNGSDVAIALAQNARSVDAVEIDPRLYEIGKDLHPDHPYQDPRVHVFIDDGRAFLERSHKKYDMILFALPDSLTLVAGQSSLRLESYLFTIDAMRSARAHLKPTGVFAMYNYYREQWLVDRLALTLKDAYGHPPCVDEAGAGKLAVLTVGRDPQAVRCSNASWVVQRAVPAPVTDDHPFVYLKTRTIPGFYLLTIALILAVSILLTRAAGGPLRAMSPYKDLFFMGAAFLLLETKNVVQFALLFGTTWFVNALVFGGILLAVLAAIEITARVKLPDRRVLYALLLVSLVVAYVIQPHMLLGLSFVPRLLAAIAVAFTPIMLANLIFAQRFKDVGASTIAFGANLLGAMVGGIIEYVSLITGYRALLIVIAVIYALAFATNQVSVRSAALREG